MSAPAKICMEAVSKAAPELRSQFAPDWKKGQWWTKRGELIAIWRINVQKGRIDSYVQDRFVSATREHMEPGINRLQFGQAGQEHKVFSQRTRAKAEARRRGKPRRS